jgi:hypothetical protein
VVVYVGTYLGVIVADMEARRPPTRAGAARSTVYYNLTYHDGYFPTDNAKRYIACHELGQTLGLRHTTAASCMKRAPRHVRHPAVPTTSRRSRCSTRCTSGTPSSSCA